MDRNAVDDDDDDVVVAALANLAAAITESPPPVPNKDKHKVVPSLCVLPFTIKGLKDDDRRRRPFAKDANRRLGISNVVVVDDDDKDVICEEENACTPMANTTKDDEVVPFPEDVVLGEN